MCLGYGCAPGRMMTEQVEQGAVQHQRTGSRFQIRRERMCSRVDDRHLLRPRIYVVGDDDRCQESVAVFVRDDDGVLSAERADHQMSGPPGRCYPLRGTCRKILRDTRRCQLRHHGYGAMA